MMQVLEEGLPDVFLAVQVSQLREKLAEVEVNRISCWLLVKYLRQPLHSQP